MLYQAHTVLNLIKGGQRKDQITWPCEKGALVLSFPFPLAEVTTFLSGGPWEGPSSQTAALVYQ